MSDSVSSTRLYIGNLPRNATRSEVETHFAQHGSGVLKEIKLMNGFGFIEYEDAMDARDVVPAFHGTTFMGERLVVQFARGPRHPAPYPQHERPPPRPRRTQFRMSITNLPGEVSWQDLKDFARQPGLDVVYSEVSRDRDGRGFVEYETTNDLRAAVDKLNDTDFKGQTVHCIFDPQEERPRERNGRSRSPPPYRSGGGRSYPPGPPEYYEDRGYASAGGRPPPRGYSPRRDDYRRRTPPRDYYERGYGGRSPPRGGPRGPGEDYAARPRYDDPYADPRGAPPPRRAPYEEPYANGHGRPPYAGGPPSPPRRRSPGRPPYEGGYDRQRY